MLYCVGIICVCLLLVLFLLLGLVMRPFFGAPKAWQPSVGAPIGLPPYDAKGQGTRTLQLDRPLDFAAVTDYARYTIAAGMHEERALGVNSYRLGFIGSTGLTDAKPRRPGRYLVVRKFSG